MLKRAFDIALSATGLAFLSPLFGAVAVMRGKDALYHVDRAGQGEQSFSMLKFKTMSDERDPETQELLPDEERVLPGMNFIRATGLDEIPQLWNILKGDMSFVGPRPQTPEDRSEFIEMGYGAMFDYQPGLTGPWQVYAIGRETTFEEKGQYNASYNYARDGFLGDLKIIAQTFPILRYGHNENTIVPD